MILAHQLFVELGHPVARERLARFDQLVNLELELRKHDLAEERAANRLERRPQIEQALCVGDVLGQHVLLQEHLVRRRGDLGRERRVRRRLIRVVCG